VIDNQICTSTNTSHRLLLRRLRPRPTYQLGASIEPVHLGSFNGSSKKEMQDFIGQPEKNGVILHGTLQQ